MGIVMVTGGARSGKSSFARRYIEKHAKRGILIATAQLAELPPSQPPPERRDEAGGFPWRSVHEPFRLSERLEAIDFEYNFYRSAHTMVLVDCLTAWLSNWFMQWREQPDAEDRCLQRVAELAQSLRRYQGTAVLVTGELGGWRTVPPLAADEAMFLRAAGRMNMEVAALCEQVFLLASGIPVELKSREYRL